MSIRFKADVYYKDETKKRFDCCEHPQMVSEYWLLSITPDKRKYVPKEAIAKIDVEDYWSSR